ncbi:MAG: hypothetical protein AAFQ53_06260 [Bacteroidota bacterium]
MLTTRLYAPPMRYALLVLLLLLGPAPAMAQETLGIPDAPVLWLGAGTVPGIGLQASYALPLATLLTREATFYAGFTPRRDGADGELRIAAGVGGSIRVLRAGNLTGALNAERADLDVGLRFGPSFLFALYEQTAASRARAFRVFIDPFVRGAYQFENGLVVYGELGAQDPSVRLGIGLGL